MKKNNNGFTLVELLVVIVIIGVIVAMSWPLLTRLIESNKISQYKKYGDSLVAAAKLYVDSYEEDMFYYESDLDATQKKKGQCAYISYEELKEHSLIKDFDAKGLSCYSDSTFVKVVRRNDRYTYTYYLGCGNKKPDGSKLSNSEIYYTLPKEGTLNVMDPNTCNDKYIEYKLTYNSKGGSSCESQSVYVDEYTKEEWGPLCNPTKKGYTFTGWKDASGNTITEKTIATGNLTVYAQWKANKVYIQYKMNGGSLTNPHSASISSSKDNLLYNGSLNITTLNYGEDTSAEGLWNHNNSNGINIVRTGYHIDPAAAWNKKDDGTGKSYSETKVYNAKDFCDASEGDCVVTLYAKWIKNKVIIKYDMNGGFLRTPHDSGFTSNGNKVLYNKSETIQTVYYGGKLDNDGLLNYNNQTWLNIGKMGHTAPEGEEWNTKPNGTGKSYSHQHPYNASDFCDATSRDCTVTLYVRWIPSKVIIRYQLGGGSLLPDRLTSITASGGNIVYKGTTNAQEVAYGGTIGTDGLWDYNNPTWLNIGKNGKHAVAKQEWKDSSTGKTFDQSKNYTQQQLCDASYSNCILNLSPNWIGNKVYIKQNANGGSLASPHSSTVKMDSSGLLSDNGNTILRTINYDSRMEASGLWDYNNTGAINLKKTGYQIDAGAEWSQYPDGSGKLYDQAYAYRDSDFCDAKYNDCTVTVYARWKIGNYKINYNYNGGTKPSSGVPSSYTYGKGATIDGKPTRSGYTFNGWSENASLSSPAFTKTIGKTETESKTFYAKWCQNCASVANGSCMLTSTPAGTCSYETKCNAGYTISNNGKYNPKCTAKGYNITYEYNGGTAPSKGVPSTYTHGEGATINGKPTRNGYTFNGWSESSSLSSPAFTKTIGKTAKEDKKFYAKWCQNCASVTNGTCKLTATTAGSCSYETKCNTGYEISNNGKYNPTCTAKKYNITYAYNGGTAPSNGVPSTYTYGAGATINGRPTKDKYTFNGWSESSSLTLASFSKTIGNTATGSKTYYAKWCKNCQDVTNGKCELNATTAGTCTYTTKCNKGYTIASGNETPTPTCRVANSTFSPYLKSRMAEAASGDANLIRAIKKGTSIPANGVRAEAPGSDNPIYLSFSSGTIYWYSDSTNVYLPEQSNYLLSGFPNLTDVSGLATVKADKATNFYGMFANDYNLTSLNGLQNWNTSKVTSVHDMFLNTKYLTDISALRNWDVSNVTDFVSIFFGSQSLSDISPLSNWNMSSAIEIRCMFYRNYKLSDISALRNWDVSNVTDMQCLFFGDYNLKDISPLENWKYKMRKVINMSSMFSEDWYELSESMYSPTSVHKMQIQSLTPLKDWQLNSLTNMSLFCNGCASIGTSARDLDGWNIGSINIDRAFAGAESHPSWYQ